MIFVKLVDFFVKNKYLFTKFFFIFYFLRCSFCIQTILIYIHCLVYCFDNHVRVFDLSFWQLFRKNNWGSGDSRSDIVIVVFIGCLIGSLTSLCLFVSEEKWVCFGLGLEFSFGKKVRRDGMEFFFVNLCCGVVWVIWLDAKM